MRSFVLIGLIGVLRLDLDRPGSQHELGVDRDEGREDGHSRREGQARRRRAGIA